MCTGVLLGIAQDPNETEELQALYQFYLEEIRNRDLGKVDDEAEAIGIIRGAQIEAIAQNSDMEEVLTEQADQCVEDIPSCLPKDFFCDRTNTPCCPGLTCRTVLFPIGTLRALCLD